MSAENILLSPKKGQIGTLRDPKHEVLGNEVPHGPSLEPSAPKLNPTIPEDNITIREDYRKKIELKHQKTISIGEAKHLATSSLSSKAV